MIIEEQITIEASEVTESCKVYSRYEKEPMHSNFDGIFSNVNKKAMCKEELNWTDEKIKRVFDEGKYDTGDYTALLELALKIQIAELSQNNEFLISVSS